MFSGIIESTAVVHSVHHTSDGATLVIAFPFLASAVVLGASIAINGTCLTVTSIDSDHDGHALLSFDAIHETLRKTNLGSLIVGSIVNFERSVTPLTRMDGHLVTGHVDTTAVLQQRTNEGNAIQLRFTIDPAWRLYIAQKGSITVNGVSLTVGAVGESFFEVYIIPHTAAVTNLGAVALGDQVNIEVDTVARYVVNYLSQNPAFGVSS
jgi:riboflavin synthase